MTKLFIKEFYAEDIKKDLSKIANEFAKEHHCFPIQIQSITMPKSFNDDGLPCKNIRVLTVLFEQKENKKEFI